MTIKPTQYSVIHDNDGWQKKSRETKVPFFYFQPPQTTSIDMKIRKKSSGTNKTMCSRQREKKETSTHNKLATLYGFFFILPSSLVNIALENVSYIYIFMSLSISNLIWIFNIPSNKHFQSFFFHVRTRKKQEEKRNNKKTYTCRGISSTFIKIYFIHTTVNRIASVRAHTVAAVARKIKELCIKNSITNDGNDEIFDEAQVVIFFTTSYQ